MLGRALQVDNRDCAASTRAAQGQVADWRDLEAGPEAQYEVCACALGL